MSLIVNNGNCNTQKKINIEISRKRTTKTNTDIKVLVFDYISKLSEIEARKTIRFGNTELEGASIIKHVDSIIVCENISLPIDFNNINWFIYILSSNAVEVGTIEDGNGDNSEEIAATNHWLMPSQEFHGLWESLIYEEGIKENLLRFVETIMFFSNRQIDPNIISCNRIVLLHGPPGTGKTSLCQSLAQKLSVRMMDRYQFVHLVEINSHSLFSKWFSESGKLVMKLFAQIVDLIEHQGSLVVVLIDEVESIAYARDSVSSHEPSDSLRVVNAVLTQLDQIRKYPNVLILTTSNLTTAIDLAFLDRADIKQFIGNPNAEAIFEIYSSAIKELIRTKIILSTEINLKSKDELKQICEMSCGLSGRTLRKIPFLAHALHLNKETVDLDEFLIAMRSAVGKYLEDKGKMNNKILNVN